MTNRIDILVLGAGVVGLSAARQLLARGARVTVLDPHPEGGQGSRAAAGVAIPSVRLLEDAAMQDFTRDAKPVLAEDLDALGTHDALRRGQGILRPMQNEKARAALEARAQHAPDWLGRWISAEEVFALEPALAGGALCGAYLDEQGHMVDTAAYLAALLHDVGRRGGQVRLSEAAQLVSDSAQGVEVRTSTATLKADWLVVAAGAWSGGLPGLPPLPVRPVRGQMLTVFHPTVRLTRIVSGPSYLAPWRAGEVVVGATEENAGFASYPTPEGLLHLSAVLARLAPALREARFTGAWAGLRSTTPNGRPLLGRYPGAARTLLATGHGGQGILTGGLSGRAIAEYLLTGRSDAAAPFEPERVLAQPRPAETP